MSGLSGPGPLPSKREVFFRRAIKSQCRRFRPPGALLARASSLGPEPPRRRAGSGAAVARRRAAETVIAGRGSGHDPCLLLSVQRRRRPTRVTRAAKPALVLVYDHDSIGAGPVSVPRVPHRRPCQPTARWPQMPLTSCCRWAMLLYDPRPRRAWSGEVELAGRSRRRLDPEGEPMFRQDESLQTVGPGAPSFTSVLRCPPPSRRERGRHSCICST